MHLSHDLTQCFLVMTSCRAGLRTLMATGDYHHTALAVARGSGMIPPKGQVVIIQKAAKPTVVGPATKELAAKIAASKTAVGTELKQQTVAKEALKTQTQAVLKRIATTLTANEALKPQMHTGVKGTTTAVAAHQGLTFHLENSTVDQDDALQLLTAIAQVGFQCKSQ